MSDCRLVLQLPFVQSIVAKYLVENEDVVGAAPIGDVQTEILLLALVRQMLEVWRYIVATTYFMQFVRSG